MYRMPDWAAGLSVAEITERLCSQAQARGSRRLLGWLVPAVCPQCGDVTAPFLLIRPDDSALVLCASGHWTPARGEPQP